MVDDIRMWLYRDNPRFVAQARSIAAQAHSVGCGWHWALIRRCASL
jgi:hypothetical protein